MAHTRSPSATTDDGERSAEYPDAKYVHDLPDAERERRMSPWGYDSWDDVDPEAVECKRYSGNTEGSLVCHAHNCPDEELVELLGEPVDFEPGHPGDFCEEYEYVDCGRTGRMVVEHYAVANEYSTVRSLTPESGTPECFENSVDRVHHLTFGCMTRFPFSNLLSWREAD